LGADNFVSANAGRTITLTGVGGGVSIGVLDTPANLSISAPSVTFGGALGAVTRLGTVDIVSDTAMSLPEIRAQSLLARTTAGTITLSGALDAAATSGAAITLASGGDIDNSGAHSLTVGSGARWLIYSQSPANNTLGGLSGDFIRYSCSYGGSCGSIPSSGNGLLYRVTPVLVVTPVGLTSRLRIGSPVPSLVGYDYRLSGYFAGDEGLDVVTGSLNGRTSYQVGRGAGAYTIGYASGGLLSLLGYGFMYGENPSGLIVDGSLSSDLSLLFGGASATPSALERSRVVQTGEAAGGSIQAGGMEGSAPVQAVLAETTHNEATTQQLYRFSPELDQWLNPSL
jgi:hypothetical protein